MQENKKISHLLHYCHFWAIIPLNLSKKLFTRYFNYTSLSSKQLSPKTIVLSWEKEMATHSSILAWRIPWRRSLVGYSPRCRKQSDMTEQLNSLLVNISKYLCIFSFSGNLSVIFVFWVYFGSDCYSYESNVFFFSCLMLLIFTFLLSSQILLLWSQDVLYLYPLWSLFLFLNI